MDCLDDAIPRGVDERLGRAIEAATEACPGVFCESGTGCLDDSKSAREIDEVLMGVDLGGLDVEALIGWFNNYELPDLDSQSRLERTPHCIPLPPTEPAGAWASLEPLLADVGEKGDAAALVLYMLGAARGAAAFRQDSSP